MARLCRSPSEALKARYSVEQYPRIRCAIPARILLEEPASVRAVGNRRMQHLVVVLRRARRCNCGKR